MPSATPTSTPTANTACTGDCTNDRAVTVDELLTMVNIALGNAGVATCTAGDANHDGQITVDEILAAVTNTLNGCPAGSPTATATQASTSTPISGQLLMDSADMLVTFLDLFTGLPYDQLPCCSAAEPCAVQQAWGVIPQLNDAHINIFPGVIPTVSYRFTDHLPAGDPPTLLYALEMQLHLDPGNDFGGIVWEKHVDISRYRQLKIRYQTSAPNTTVELKLNSGTSGHEDIQQLQGSPAGAWLEKTLDIPESFPSTDGRALNYLVIATSLSLAQTPDPTIWIDQLSFIADPSQIGSCAVSCEPTEYPDLACDEPMTGVVNIANALSSFSLLMRAQLMPPEAATSRAAKILDQLNSFPVHQSGKWFQDWHSPTSGMPQPPKRDFKTGQIVQPVASLSDQPQLYAALMVVEMAFDSEPSIRSLAQTIRSKMDFSLLYESGSGCPGTLHGAIERCGGFPQDWVQEVYGNDSLLGSFLAVASGDVPACFWSKGLSQKGCALRGPAEAPWYTTGDYCTNGSIPASHDGGPFLQLAPLLYLDSDKISISALSLASSAANVLRAQARFATEQQLTLFGWANASDPDQCAYMTCQDDAFVQEKVTPYISAMGLDLLPTETAANLRAFHDAGVDAPLNTGFLLRSLGMRDAWNQETETGRNAYLYLDTGWTVLGMLNASYGGLVRTYFGAHPVASVGYHALEQEGVPCPPVTPNSGR